MSDELTNQEVQDAYVDGQLHDCYYEGDVKLTPDGMFEAERFQTFLAEVRRQAAEEALLNAADDPQAAAFPSGVNFRAKRMESLGISVKDWLHARAAEYRKEQ